MAAPDFTEWHEWIGDFVLKWLCRGYIAFAFRGLDDIPDHIRENLELGAEERGDIAKPIAHLASRSKGMGKYGRVLIDSTDGVVACITLGMWMARVNRIARQLRNEGAGIEQGQPSGSDVPEEPGNSVQGPAYRAGFNGVAVGHGYN